MIEEWRQIPGYEKYQISNLGNCKSEHYPNRLLKKLYNEKGYIRYRISGFKFAHKLVAMAFLDHTPNGMREIIHHKNNIKSDNSVDNLEVTTNRENSYTHHKGTSKYKGVCWNNTKSRWLAQIRDGKKKYGKNFKYEFEAFMWYEKQKRLILM